jgi:uncharacterized protein YidB (DUF937 family)
MGENQPISSDQLQNVLGSEQINAIATRMGVRPSTGIGGLAAIALAKPQ